MLIKINDKDVKFGFGLYFLGKAQKKNNTDLSGLLNGIAKNPLSDVVDLMYFSAQIESELDETDLKISKREFLDFLEETKDFNNSDGVLAKWSSKLIETVRGSFLPEVKEDEVKEGEDEKKK